MKILFLTPQIPYPPHSGGRIVQWNTIRRFARECETHVVSLYHHPDEREHLDTVRAVCASAEAFSAHGKWSLTPLLRCLASTWPYKAHRFYNPDMADYGQRLIAEREIEVIHCQNFYTTTYMRGDEPCLKVHYKENVEGNILLRYGRASRNPLVKAAAWLEGHRTRRFELAACRKFDRVLSISPLDRDALLTLDPALPVTHQRPGVDLGEYPLMPEPEGPPEAIFTGAMSYYPNADGVIAFLEQGWPRVRRALPDMRLWIVGADPPESIRAWHDREGVQVTGRVPSAQEYLERAAISLVPLRVGGGIRLKILEAMASGRAIVSTPVGCEGLDGVDGEHLRVAEMPDAFADAVIELARDRELRLRLRANARALIEREYDWDAVIRRQVEQYRQWAALRPAPAGATLDR